MLRITTADYQHLGIKVDSLHENYTIHPSGAANITLGDTDWVLAKGDYQLINVEDVINPICPESIKVYNLDRRIDLSNPVKGDQATACDFLSKALKLLEERGKDYDQPQGERSMGKTVSAFNSITGKSLTESEGWLLLQLLKDVRQWQNPDKYHADSAEDCISYAALKAEALICNR